MTPSSTSEKAPGRLLVVRLSALGDVIRTLPLLPPLKRRFPAASVAWLCEAPGREILEGQPFLEEILVFPRQSLASEMSRGRLLAACRRLRRLIKDLRQRRFDLVLDAQGTFKSSLLMRLTGAPVRVGFARSGAKEFLPGAATRLVPVPPHPLSRVEKALLLLEPIGADAAHAAWDLPCRADLAAEAGALWQAAGPRPRIVLSPGASRAQAYKRWPWNRYAELILRLERLGATPRIAWGPGEKDLALKVAGETGRPFLMLPRTSLRLLAELIRQADLFVGNDSGPTHLAALVGTPSVALYGPTDPILNAAWGPNHRQIIAPLAAGESRLKDAALMERIQVDQVYEAVKLHLEACRTA